MTAKERLYKDAVRYVAKLLGEGSTITAARIATASKFGLSYPTVTRLTRDLSPKRAQR